MAMMRNAIKRSDCTCGQRLIARRAMLLHTERELLEGGEGEREGEKHHGE